MGLFPLHATRKDGRSLLRFHSQVPRWLGRPGAARGAVSTADMKADEIRFRVCRDAIPRHGAAGQGRAGLTCCLFKGGKNKSSNEYRLSNRGEEWSLCLPCAIAGTVACGFGISQDDYFTPRTPSTPPLTGDEGTTTQTLKLV